MMKHWLEAFGMEMEWLVDMLSDTGGQFIMVQMDMMHQEESLVCRGSSSDSLFIIQYGFNYFPDWYD